ncbi:MAG: hypothetical protein WDZ77_02485 [Candidatus Pacearchaeota archaeon]
MAEESSELDSGGLDELIRKEINSLKRNDTLEISTSSKIFYNFLFQRYSEKYEINGPGESHKNDGSIEYVVHMRRRLG